MTLSQCASRTERINGLDSYAKYGSSAVASRPVGGVFAITHAADFALHGIFTLPATAPAEPPHQAGQFQQVHDPKRRSAAAQCDLGIGRNHVRPLRPDRTHRPVTGFQQQGGAITVVPLAYARQLLPAERMKRMRYPDKACGCDGSLCILR
jgi:hypothetical protein